MLCHSSPYVSCGTEGYSNKRIHFPRAEAQLRSHARQGHPSMQTCKRWPWGMRVASVHCLPRAFALPHCSSSSTETDLHKHTHFPHAEAQLRSHARRGRPVTPQCRPAKGGHGECTWHRCTAIPEPSRCTTAAAAAAAPAVAAAAAAAPAATAAAATAAAAAAAAVARAA